MKRGKRIQQCLTIDPSTYGILAVAAEDMNLTISRTLDVIVPEWDELNEQPFSTTLAILKRLDALAEQIEELKLEREPSRAITCNLDRV